MDATFIIVLFNGDRWSKSWLSLAIVLSIHSLLSYHRFAIRAFMRLWIFQGGSCDSLYVIRTIYNVIGGNSTIGRGECECSFIGPFTNMHHESLSISCISLILKSLQYSYYSIWKCEYFLWEQSGFQSYKSIPKSSWLHWRRSLHWYSLYSTINIKVSMWISSIHSILLNLLIRSFVHPQHCSLKYVLNGISMRSRDFNCPFHWSIFLSSLITSYLQLIMYGYHL